MKTLADYPEILGQFHPTKNGSVKPEQIRYGSNKKFWWQCNAGPDHVWQASVDKRTISKRGCPFCGSSPMRASSTNNLAKRFPEAAKFWHPAKNGELKPKNILGSSNKSYWWLCAAGHDFLAKVNKVTSKPWSCPFCSGKRVGQGNSLLDKFPEVAAEWDYEKNGEITPDKIASKSNKRFWFICPLNHSYKTAVSYRTNKGSGCPNCTSKSSQQELRVYSELKWIFPDAEHRYRFDGVEFDVFIPSIDLAVEYDGVYWHQNSVVRDAKKGEFCNNRGFKILRVRETPLPKMSNLDVIVHPSGICKSDLNALVEGISHLCDAELSENFHLEAYVSENSFVNECFYQEHKTYLAIPHPDDSLAAKYPEISEFWDFHKNYPLKPQHFLPGSGKKVFWICPRGHSFSQKINDRRRYQGCLICNSSGRRGYRFKTSNDKRQGKLF